MSVRPVLRRLARRLAVGLFLDIWPIWAAGSLLVTGTAALVCRMFFAGAAPILPWFWLVPVVTVLPVLVLCWRRAYRPGDVAALADWLGGGRGTLLAFIETNDPAWAGSTLVDAASTFTLPRYQWRRAAAALLPGIAFLAVALMLPQRIPAAAANPALAAQIAADLKAAVVELQQQDLITPAEEQRLEEEIRKIQESAEKRVDASAWEAADALKEQLVAGLSEKQQAVKWAQDSLARYAAAAKAGGQGASTSAASAELTNALEKLAESGMLGSASAELLKGLKDGTLPADAASLQALAEALGQQLADTNGKFAGLGELGQGFGRFDPSEFPTGTGPGLDGDGDPGRGGVNRGRGDAALTWGEETKKYDHFTSQALPPGAPRSPDDWSPAIVLPGAPQVMATLGAQSAARQFADTAGLAAWRRSLAPRHQSAVKKYFDKDKDKDK